MSGSWPIFLFSVVFISCGSKTVSPVQNIRFIQEEKLLLLCLPLRFQGSGQGTPRGHQLSRRPAISPTVLWYRALPYGLCQVTRAHVSAQTDRKSQWGWQESLMHTWGLCSHHCATRLAFLRECQSWHIRHLLSWQRRTDSHWAHVYGGIRHGFLEDEGADAEPHCEMS